MFGYCGYLTLVVGLHWGYSLLPAIVVLSLLVVPYIAKATELALNQVPLAYREGGEGRGMSKVYLLRRVILRPAVPGILTGLIIALAISVGETAPLLFSAGNTNAYPALVLIHQPVGYLTYAVFTDVDSPIQATKDLSYDASLILVLIVLFLIMLSRVIVRMSQKYSPNRGDGGGGRAERRAMREAANNCNSGQLAAGRLSGQ